MIEELKRLEKEATEGPWGLETVATSVGSCHKIGPFPSNGVHGETHACVYADNVRVGEIGNTIGNELRANAALIVALRNNAAALIAVTEAAGKLVERRHADYPHSNGQTCSFVYSSDLDAIAAALAALRACAESNPK